jgi:hypothetical protein
MENIDHLRELLFSQIKALREGKDPQEIERANAVAGLAQVMINSAKVEVDYLKAIGGKVGTGFIPDRKPPHPRLAEQNGTNTGTVPPYTGKLMPGHG